MKLELPPRLPLVRGLRLVQLGLGLGPALARARYLALALPAFALFSTFQAGCAGRASPGYYYAQAALESEDCTGTSDEEPSGATYTNCDDEHGGDRDR